MAKRSVVIGVIVVVVVVVVAVVLGVVLWKVLDNGNKPASPPFSPSSPFSPMGSPLQYFGTDDALNVSWYQGANSKQQTQAAVDGPFQMIEGYVQLRYYGLPNQTTEVVMAQPPYINGDNTLSNWLDTIIKKNDKGLKINFRNTAVMAPALTILKQKVDRLHFPVQAHADVLKGPGSQVQPIDPNVFLQTVGKLFPNMTLSLGWPTGCCAQMYTQQQMDAMYAVVKPTYQPATFSARAALLKGSWPIFKNLLLKDPTRFSLTVWTPAGRNDWEGADPYDMLYVRNDCNKRLIYYALPGPQFAEFKRLVVTAGSPLNYFPLAGAATGGGRDAMSVSWAHAVNSRSHLQQALTSTDMMLEADVNLEWYGFPNQTTTPIMAHPPDVTSDVTLQQWLTLVSKSSKGIKLDFKSIDSVLPAMKVLNSIRASLTQPVWINADVLIGPNSNNSTPVNATEFKSIILAHFPQCTISPGWKTSYDPAVVASNVYTAAMVDEMLAYISGLKQPITFPIRASMLRSSWSELKRLLAVSRATTLTVWSTTADPVNPDDLVWVRRNSEVDRVYWDLPAQQMAAFVARLNATTTSGTMGSPLQYFGTDDALNVSWYQGANSKQQTQAAVDGPFQMIEGYVQLRYYGLPNQTTEVVMAQPPYVNGDNTLSNWLDAIIKKNDKGLKINFRNTAVMAPALTILKQNVGRLHFPVQAHADVLKGPGSQVQPIDPNAFLQTVGKLFPNMTLSLGWPTGCCAQMYTQQQMDAMYAVVKPTFQPATFSARAALLKGSWPIFKNLLLKDPTRFSLTVWTPAGRNDWEGADPYDMLYVRNDCNKRLIYYALPGPQFAEFKRLVVTAGSPLNYFPLAGAATGGGRDAMSVSWAHAVNSRSHLQQALTSTDMMLEADVNLEWYGFPNQTTTPIMAHPPDVTSDVTLQQWLTLVSNSSKGIKLDFKSIDSVLPAMKVLNSIRASLTQPVWINADVLIGPNSNNSTPVNATEFKSIILAHFPQCTISPGWKTSYDPAVVASNVYTAAMVDEMLAYISGLKQPITFPIRASMLRSSWTELKRLLAVSRATTLTVWSTTADPVNPDDLVWVRRNSEVDRVYWDLPAQQMTAFVARLNATTTFGPMGSPLQYFGTDDALNVSWYQGANSKQQTQAAVDGPFQIIEGYVQLRYYGLPNQTTEVVMAQPPYVNGDNTLSNWLDAIIKKNDKGLKINFRNTAVMAPALTILKQKVGRLHFPVQAHADVLKGPGSQVQPIDPNLFLQTVGKLFPNMTLSLGWPTGCCAQMYTQQQMDAMYAVVKPTYQPATFSARAALLKGSWPIFKNLLLKDPTRFSLTVWTPAGRNDWEGADPYDMLYVRNDCNKRLIYYALPGPQFAEFKRLVVTAGSPLNYFPLAGAATGGGRDAISVSWAHAVNSRSHLQQALTSTDMMLEADVNLEWYGFPNQTTTPIMAHPPDVTSDVTLQQWLTLVSKSSKGIKLDFKSIDSVLPAMKVLNSIRASLTQPVWINADVLIGPNSNSSTPVNATEFKSIILAHFPQCTISPGWKTSYDPAVVASNVYTAAMVDEMLAYVSGLKQPITFPIRASMLRSSWTELKRLLAVSRATTLTVWSTTADPVNPDDLVWVRRNSEVDRVYWDLPAQQMAAFVARLNATTTSGPMGSPLQYFGTDDALNVSWYQGANSKQQTQAAVDGPFQIIEGYVQLRYYGLPNQTTEVVMAQPPYVNGDNTLSNWLDTIIKKNDKGLKINFRNTAVMAPALTILKQKVDRLHFPVQAHADVLKGPGSQVQPIDPNVFLQTVGKLFPNMTLSLGWPTGCCAQMYTQQQMDAMYAMVKPTYQPATFSARAALLKGSWPIFKKLLLKDPTRFTLTVWTPAGRNDWEGADPYDMLYVRNDCNKRLIYYALPGPQFAEFKRLVVTAGSPLNYFPLAGTATGGGRDAMSVSWAHAVNSRSHLQQALTSTDMMLEADVNLEWYGFPNQTTTPIMAHPPDVTSDVTLQQWLTLVSKSSKGIKLDFKSIDSVLPAMKVLNSIRASLTQPVWINADVLIGPNSNNSTPVNATEFKSIILAHFPQCTISPGWKTSYDPAVVASNVYTAAMVDEMLAYVSGLKQPITFPIRASMLRSSWTELKRLLAVSRATTLTVWSTTADPVNPDDLVWVRRNSEVDRVYWDLPAQQMAAFVARLNATTTFGPMGSPLQYFGTDDALNVTWYQGANSKQQTQAAVDGPFQIIEGYVQLRYYGLPNQTTEVVMAQPPYVNGDNTLSNWLDTIIKKNDKGLKINFRNTAVMAPALTILKQKVDRLHFPVQAHADVLKGPGSQVQPIDPNVFLQTVGKLFPNMTLSLGWPTGCCAQMYTQQQMDAMYAVVKPTYQPATFSARAALLKGSWPIFKNLLLKDPTRFSLTVWTPAGRNDWEGADPYDMLYVRNDCNKRLIYYALPGPQFAEFKRLVVTAGSPLNYFPLAGAATGGGRDAMSVSWAHAVNSRSHLQQALSSTDMMLEADVNLEWYGFPNQTTTPIMAHPPDVTSDVTLQQWLTLVSKSSKGIKLDFKSIDSVLPAMKVLNSIRASLTQPVWINADVLIGPNSNNSTPVNATEFKSIILAHFPQCTISPGWKTSYDPAVVASNVYTAAMVDEMLAHISGLKQPITFPIRASMLRSSWTELKRLLAVSRATTLTVWSTTADPVNPDDLVWVRRNSEVDRVYWDLPAQQMAAFVARLNATTTSG